MQVSAFTFQKLEESPNTRGHGCGRSRNIKWLNLVVNSKYLTKLIK